MKKIICLAAVLMSVFLATCVFAKDGVYEAFIYTANGSYRGTATVEYGSVDFVLLRNGDQINLEGAKVINSEADGTDLNGNKYHIVIEHYDNYDVSREGTGITQYPINDEGVARVPDGGSRSVP